jgi:outer membrane immunogenic protein
MSTNHIGYRISLALCALLSVLSGGGANAADWIDNLPLRGSLAGGPVRWDGLYLGAHGGSSVLNTNPTTGVGPLVGFILRNTTIENELAPSTWTTLPSTSANSTSYGGFIGYNWQMDQLVLGFDIGYSRPSLLQTGAIDSIHRSGTTSDGYLNDISIDAQSTARLVDYATLRGRAGYAVEQFLPYAVLGLAIGRFDVTRSATVTAVSVDPLGVMPTLSLGPQTLSDGKKNAFAAGFLAGAGFDVAILPNFFLRGEWEYIIFTSVQGITSNISTLRAGAGIRF